MASFKYTVPVTIEIENLTLGECKLLTEWGYSQEDVKQCDDAVKQCKYIYSDENSKRHRISCKRAREVLGELEWVSGIARAAFHWSAWRNVDDSFPEKGHVEFDCASMFK